mgnify:CR=1 FL=1
MKHIYILDNNFNGTVFGVGTYLKNLIRILKDEPILVTMVTLFNGKESVEIVSENNIRYIHIPAACTRPARRRRYSRGGLSRAPASPRVCRGLRRRRRWRHQRG